MITKNKNTVLHSAYTPYYVYALMCPLIKEIKYIGQSKNPQNRLKQHISNPSPLLESWINKLKNKGKEPILTILETGEKYNICELEKKYIEQYSKNSLLNINSNDKNSTVNLKKQIIQLNNRIYNLQSDINLLLNMKRGSGFINDIRKEIRNELLNELKNNSKL